MITHIIICWNELSCINQSSSALRWLRSWEFEVCSSLATYDWRFSFQSNLEETWLTETLDLLARSCWTLRLLDTCRVSSLFDFWFAMFRISIAILRSNLGILRVSKVPWAIKKEQGERCEKQGWKLYNLLHATLGQTSTGELESCCPIKNKVLLGLMLTLGNWRLLLLLTIKHLDWVVSSFSITFSASAAMKRTKRTVKRMIVKLKLALQHGSWAGLETTNSETDLFLSLSRGRTPTKPVQTLLKMKIRNVSIQRSTHNRASPRSP